MMLQSKSDLNEYLAADNDFLRPSSRKEKVIAEFVQYPSQALRKYLYYLRKQEYYINTAKGSKLKGILGLYYERQKNKLGLKLGIEIGPNCFGKGLQIYHAGNIVVNQAVRVGKYCRLHGGNFIGNNGKSDAVPRIGDYVDIGFGAVIIGDIKIADHVTIGANAVVNKTISTPGSIVAGCPARTIHILPQYQRT